MKSIKHLSAECRFLAVMISLVAAGCTSSPSQQAKSPEVSVPTPAVTATAPIQSPLPLPQASVSPKLVPLTSPSPASSFIPVPNPRPSIVPSFTPVAVQTLPTAPRAQPLVTPSTAPSLIPIAKIPAVIVPAAPAVKPAIAPAPTPLILPPLVPTAWEAPIRTFAKASNLFQFTFTWENTKNLTAFREDPSEKLSMDLVETDRSKVDVIAFKKNIDPRILKYFLDGNKIYWPQHPYNSSNKVPFFGSASVGKSIQVCHTASRSLLSIEKDAPAFSIKSGTNYPHLHSNNEHKAETEEDVLGSLLVQPFVNQISDILPPSKILGLLPEILILRDKKTNNGVLIRDLNQINNDNIYIVGLSIPYVGRDIAMRNGIPFEEFWIKHYAEQVGRAKAHLLMDYGSEMKTPNPQNILVELTKNYIPTGKIFFRDLGGDSSMYGPWVHALKLKNVLKQHDILGYGTLNKLIPYGSNTMWRLDESEEYSFTQRAVRDMIAAHDYGWVDEIRIMLRITSPDVNSIDQINAFLPTAQGEQAIVEYHKSLGTFDKLSAADRMAYKDQLYL